jgi:uncharacterized membrane protein YeiB
MPCLFLQLPMRLLHALNNTCRKCKEFFWITLIIGIMGTVSSPYIEKVSVNLFISFGRAVSGLFGTLVTFSKAAFYVTAFILVWESRFGRAVLRPLCAVGRMALTSYLAVYVICLLLFFDSPYYRNFQISFAMMLGVAIWLFEIIWSNLWFTRFRFGPMEWVWRLLTYGYSPIKKAQ